MTVDSGQYAGDKQRLIKLVSESEWLMHKLTIAAKLGLSSWCIGAGAVRNLVWDYLHGYSEPSALSDIDVVHINHLDLSAEADAKLELQLQILSNVSNWEVTNQAAVHLWYETTYGYPVAAVNTLSEAIATWPEYATCVGVSLGPNSTLNIIAPFGLSDLFNMIIRRNPARVSTAIFKQRVLEKQFLERWPMVRVIHD